MTLKNPISDVLAKILPDYAQDLELGHLSNPVVRPLKERRVLASKGELKVGGVAYPMTFTLEGPTERYDGRILGVEYGGSATAMMEYQGEVFARNVVATHLLSLAELQFPENEVMLDPAENSVEFKLIKKSDGKPLVQYLYVFVSSQGYDVGLTDVHPVDWPPQPGQVYGQVLLKHGELQAAHARPILTNMVQNVVWDTIRAEELQRNEVGDLTLLADYLTRQGLRVRLNTHRAGDDFNRVVVDLPDGSIRVQTDGEEFVILYGNDFSQRTSDKATMGHLQRLHHALAGMTRDGLREFFKPKPISNEPVDAEPLTNAMDLV